MEKMKIVQNLKNREIEYKILNPGGNKTALVIGNEYSDEERKIINAKILNENKEVEQVGFINQRQNELEMAGGEFCVNATRCAIWEYLNGKNGEMKIKVSGCKSKIIGGITEQRQVYVNLPIHKKINDLIEKKGKFNLVKLDGILLGVVDEEDSKDEIKKLKKDEEKAKLEFKKMMQTFDTSEKAVGIIWLEKEKGKIKINPVIWVKTIDTVYYETACGSGSLATAIYKNSIQGIECLEIRQPSGYDISIELEQKQNIIEKAKVIGRVKEA